MPDEAEEAGCPITGGSVAVVAGTGWWLKVDDCWQRMSDGVRVPLDVDPRTYEGVQASR
jgi:hypothetical protein